MTGDKLELDEESDAFMDALNGLLNNGHSRMVNVIDNRFRTHRRRILAVEHQLRHEVIPMLREIRLALRLAVGLVVAAPPILGLLRALGVV